ncbi:glycosyl hydrolase 53 family protein [Terrisporobacter sp.]
MMKGKVLSLFLASAITLGTVSTPYVAYANAISGVTKVSSVTNTIIKNNYPKISDISENTILGADFSNYQQDLIWGKSYKDYKNKDISNTLFDFIKSQGINTISVKVSTDDTSSISLENAIKTLKEAQKSGLKTNMVLLYSDEMTYGNKQDLPKSWANENDITTKACDYTKSVLEKLEESNVKLDILTIGNEVNYNFLGYTGDSEYKGWEAMAKIAEIAKDKGIKSSVSISETKTPEDIKWILQKLNQDYLNIDFDYVGLNIYPTDNTISYINSMRKVFEEEEKSAGKKAEFYISGITYARQDEKGSASVSSQANGTYEALEASISKNNTGGLIYTGAENVGSWTSFFDENGRAVPSLSIFALAKGMSVDNGVEEEVKDPYEYGGETGVKEQKVDIDKISTMYSSSIRGVDISSYTALKKAGVKYYNYEGKEESLLKILHDNGVNYIRVRIWNDPYNEKGELYGGGNCDVESDLAIAKEAAKYGMKMLLDFHYSDFWADPAQQIIPKAWEADKNDSDKMAKHVYEYTKETIKKFQKTGVEVGMVQIGNEITNGMLGITTNRDLGESYKGVWADETKSKQVNKYLSAGSKAVKEVSNALVALQLETPNVKKYKTIMNTWKRDGVNYDVLGSSYYPYWSTWEKANTPEKLTEVQKLAADYGKLFVVLESGWVTTTKDADGTPNSIGESDDTSAYQVNAQGQVDMLKDLYTTVGNQKNGLGAFYWEPAWIPVKPGWANWEYNKQVADKYGTGWASKGAVGYFPDFKMYYNGQPAWGGTSWDNQGLFDINGYALQSLKFYKNSQTKKGDQKTVVVNLLNKDKKEIGTKYITKLEVGKKVSLSLPKIDGYNTPECSVKVASSDEDVIFINATYTKKSTVSISSATVSNIKNKYYTGKEQTQNVVVSLKGKTLKKDKDYTVKYSNNKAVGTATITITGKGNYTGTIKKTFKITKAKTTSITSATVSNIKNKYYTGKAQTQSVVVRLKGKTLKKDKDYTVKYSNNKAVGTATITITGKGNYTGTIKKTFKISIKKSSTYTIDTMKYKVTNTRTDGKGTVELLSIPSNNKKTTITVPSTVKISGKTFRVSSIGGKAFRKNTYVKKIVLGKYMTTIGQESFYGCKNLKTIEIKSTNLKSVGKNAIAKIYKKAYIKVPSSRVRTYKKLFNKYAGWKNGYVLKKY